MRWARILLSGTVAGAIWYLLSALCLSLFARPFLAWARVAGTAPHWRGGVFLAIDLAMGVWAVWLYSTITTRSGSTPNAAVIAGVAWWTIKSLQSAKWAGLGLIPRDVILAPLLTTLAATVLASLVGAWLFDGRRIWGSHGTSRASVRES